MRNLINKSQAKGLDKVAKTNSTVFININSVEKELQVLDVWL